MLQMVDLLLKEVEECINLELKILFCFQQLKKI